MTAPGTRWASRLAAVALPLALLGLVVFGVAAPLLDRYASARSSVQHTAEMLARYQAIASAREQVEARLATLRTQQAASGVFLEGVTDTLAAARLQERITGAVTEAGGRVRSVRTLPPEPREGLTRVAMRLELLADIRAVRALLYALETRSPLLIVERLEIQGRLQRARDVSVPLQVAPELLVDIEVSGYRLHDPP